MPASNRVVPSMKRQPFPSGAASSPTTGADEAQTSLVARSNNSRQDLTILRGDDFSKAGNLTPLSDDVLCHILLFCRVDDVVINFPQVNRRLYIVCTSDTLWDFLYHRDVPAVFRCVVAQNALNTTQEHRPPQRFLGWDDSSVDSSQDTDSAVEDDVDYYGDSDEENAPPRHHFPDNESPESDAVGALRITGFATRYSEERPAASKWKNLGPREVKLYYRGIRLQYYPPGIKTPMGYGGGGVICNICKKTIDLVKTPFWHRDWDDKMQAPQFDVCKLCVDEKVKKIKHGSLATASSKVFSNIGDISLKMREKVTGSPSRKETEEEEDAGGDEPRRDHHAEGPNYDSDDTNEEGVSEDVKSEASQERAERKKLRQRREDELERTTIEFDETYAKSFKNLHPIFTSKEMIDAAGRLDYLQPYFRLRRPQDLFHGDDEYQEKMRHLVSGEEPLSTEDLPPEMQTEKRDKYFTLETIHDAAKVATELEGHLEGCAAAISSPGFFHKEYMEALQANSLHAELEECLQKIDILKYEGSTEDGNLRSSNGVVGGLRQWWDRAHNPKFWFRFWDVMTVDWARKPFSHAATTKDLIGLFGTGSTSSELFFADVVRRKAHMQEVELHRQAKREGIKNPEDLRKKKVAAGYKYLPQDVDAALKHIQPEEMAKREKTLFNEEQVTVKKQEIELELHRMRAFLPSTAKLRSMYMNYREKLATFTTLEQGRQGLVNFGCIFLWTSFQRCWNAPVTWMLEFFTSAYNRDGTLRTIHQRQDVFLRWIEVAMQDRLPRKLFDGLKALLRLAWSIDIRHFLQPSRNCDQAMLNRIHDITSGFDIPAWWPVALCSLRLAKTFTGKTAWQRLGTAKAPLPFQATNFWGAVLDTISTQLLANSVILPVQDFAINWYLTAVPPKRWWAFWVYVGGWYLHKLRKRRNAAMLLAAGGGPAPPSLWKIALKAGGDLWWLFGLRFAALQGDTVASATNKVLLAATGAAFYNPLGKAIGPGAAASLKTISDEIDLDIGRDATTQSALLRYFMSQALSMMVNGWAKSLWTLSNAYEVPAVSTEEAEFLRDPNDPVQAAEIDRRAGIDYRQMRKARREQKKAAASSGSDGEDSSAAASSSPATKQKKISMLRWITRHPPGNGEEYEARRLRAHKERVSIEKTIVEKVTQRGKIIRLIEEALISWMSLSILLRHRSFGKALAFRGGASAISWLVEYFASKAVAK